MKIYDYETFKKNCKNIKAVKFKKVEEIPECYREDYFAWGKKFYANFVSISETMGTFIRLNIFNNEEENTTISLEKVGFDDYIEYVEINIGLEIE